MADCGGIAPVLWPLTRANTGMPCEQPPEALARDLVAGAGDRRQRAGEGSCRDERSRSAWRSSVTKGIRSAVSWIALNTDTRMLDASANHRVPLSAPNPRPRWR